MGVRLLHKGAALMTGQVSLAEISASIAPKLVSCKSWGDASFISLPLVYPGGAFVTVRLTFASGGIRVSDAGFAYREADSFGAGRSFSRTAKTIAEMHDVLVGSRTIYVDVPANEVERAIFDVSATSHAVAERIVSRISDDGAVSISDELHERLDNLFPQSVDYESTVTGASLTEWDVSAVTKLESKAAVFQIVANYPVAVFRASTAFHDIGALDNPPTLISVVVSKNAMGKNYGLLAQAGRVIEIGQGDDVYRRAAA